MFTQTNRLYYAYQAELKVLKDKYDADCQRLFDTFQAEAEQRHAAYNAQMDMHQDMYHKKDRIFRTFRKARWMAYRAYNSLKTDCATRFTDSSRMILLDSIDEEVRLKQAHMRAVNNCTARFYQVLSFSTAVEQE